MGEINYYHKDLHDKWGDFSLSFQMANIGSEVSRALKWHGVSEETFFNSLARALELLDFSIEDAQKKGNAGALKELVKDRYYLCDYFFDGNTAGQTPELIMKYFDEFAGLTHRSP